eukprot:TRINITY_DN211_c3_g1_i1.p1 TRINITY_DN211_c3_g1~~TRINITY_DN211_c3_g1_i1.p1  ORF type:complete len:421 (+),score=87.96 TRINITY_DN211_c3_g1_i1:63-1265(+)
MTARALYLAPSAGASSPPSPRPAARLLQQLLRERDAIAPLRSALPNLCALLDAEIARCRAAAAPASARRRVKLPVPADKFPDYNFVGRLLGPRGTTLKTLERDTGCRIMIRGKGSIRKDKEPDVRGKPGWEHVFNEPLHVVIEAPDTLHEAAASAALARAAEAVDVLLVPVPEERDALKRHQLRALAIMNGTFRGALPYASDADALPPLPSPIVSYDCSMSLFRNSSSPLSHHACGASAVSTRKCSPMRDVGATCASTSLPDLSPLSSKLLRASALDELATSSVGEDSAESSQTSEHDDNNSSASAQVKMCAGSALGAGGFIGREFYNGAFSNGALVGCTSSGSTAWDESACCSPSSSSANKSRASAGAGATCSSFETPSAHILTCSATVTALKRADDLY